MGVSCTKSLCLASVGFAGFLRTGSLEPVAFMAFSPGFEEEDDEAKEELKGTLDVIEHGAAAGGGGWL